MPVASKPLQWPSGRMPQPPQRGSSGIPSPPTHPPAPQPRAAPPPPPPPSQPTRTADPPQAGGAAAGSGGAPGAAAPKARAASKPSRNEPRRQYAPADVRDALRRTVAAEQSGLELGGKRAAADLGFSSMGTTVRRRRAELARRRARPAAAPPARPPPRPAPPPRLRAPPRAAAPAPRRQPRPRPLTRLLINNIIFLLYYLLVEWSARSILRQRSSVRMPAAAPLHVGCGQHNSSQLILLCIGDIMAQILFII